MPDYFTTSTGTFRILSDHLGSPRLVVDTSSGAVVEEIDYDEFGVVTNDTAPGTIPFGFAGGLYDKDTGLVRFGARDYDASVGRWRAKDPVRFAGRQFNLYVYAQNDPINWIDPTGKYSACTVLCSAAAKGVTSSLGLAPGPGWGAWALSSIACTAICDPNPPAPSGPPDTCDPPDDGAPPDPDPAPQPVPAPWAPLF